MEKKKEERTNLLFLSFASSAEHTLMPVNSFHRVCSSNVRENKVDTYKYVLSTHESSIILDL